MRSKHPYIVGIGGTLRPDSSSEEALRIALGEAAARGARTTLFAGPQLSMPFYDDRQAVQNANAERLIEALREADGVILASPCYHGGVSGLLKNAIDYTERMRGDVRPYLHGRVVGCIATGAGYQGPGTVLASLRSIAHALRGWPTPLGVCINTAAVKLSGGQCSDDGVTNQISIMVEQMGDFLGLDRDVPEFHVCAKKVGAGWARSSLPTT